MERLSLGCAVMLVGLAGLACKAQKEKTDDPAPSATTAETAAPSATEAPVVDAAVAPAPTHVAAKSPCKPDELFVGGKCYLKCKADMDCDGTNYDCLAAGAEHPGAKVCRPDAPAPAAPVAAPIPKGATVANPDSFQFGGPKCPSGWQQVPSANDSVACNRICTKDDDCHAGNSCTDGPAAGTKVCM